MASSVIENTIKTKSYSFTNLAQYSGSGYYREIPNYRTIAGLPSDAEILAVTFDGWYNLGGNACSIACGTNELYIIYVAGTTITSASNASVLFLYK